MLPWTIALAVLALAVLARKLLADRALRRGADRRPGRPRRVTGACRPCGGGSGRFGGHGRPDRRLRSPRHVDRTVQPGLEGAPAEHPRSGQARQLRAGADLGQVLGDSAKPTTAPAGPPDQSPVRWDRMLRGQRVARGHPASESCVDSASITTAPPMGSTATTGPMALKSTRSRTRPSNVIDRSSSPCSSCTYRSTTSAPLGASSGDSGSVPFHSVEVPPVCAEPRELDAERLKNHEILTRGRTATGGG
jgi:hypothetical protein